MTVDYSETAASSAAVVELGSRTAPRIDGIRGRSELDKAEVALVQRARLEYGAVFLCDQHHSSEAGQCGFAELLGTPTEVEEPQLIAS